MALHGIPADSAVDDHGVVVAHSVIVDYCAAVKDSHAIVMRDPVTVAMRVVEPCPGHEAEIIGSQAKREPNGNP
jgi:ribulose 1,5-bisphosphate synthetase/thiazole synthase